MSALKDPLILVLDKNDTTNVATCDGPDDLGNCPQVAWGDVVPCAGAELAPGKAAGIENWRIMVPQKQTACPVASLTQTRKSTWWVGTHIATFGAAIAALAVASAALAVAYGNSSPSSAKTASAAAAPAAHGAAAVPALSTAAVTITTPGDRYSPAYVTIAAGTTVTWHNTDSDLHSVDTAPGLAPVAFDVTLQPGGTAAFRFIKPGLYVVYCKDHVAWDSTTGLPKAASGTDIFPEAMAGVIAVTGAGATVASAPDVTMPGDLYSPAYVTIAQGTTVTWHNTDSDLHSVDTAPGLAPAAFGMNVQPGGTASFRFTKPGLYVLYCKDHVVWDTTTGLPKPAAGTDIFPESMSGAVFVTATS